MFTQTLILSLALTGSSLRIQQKEKVGKACPYTCTGTSPDTTGQGSTDFYQPTATNPSTADADTCKSCRCFLAGYDGYSFSQCGWKQQATTALDLGAHVRTCWGDYWEPAMAIGDDADDGTLARGRWSTLLQCLVNRAEVTPRAVINPTGVNPFWLDPIVKAAQANQLVNEILAKKADNPGSLPIEACPSGLGPSRTWLPVCYGGTSETYSTISPFTTSVTGDSSVTLTTAMFDGRGMCCADRLTGVTDGDLTDPGTWTDGDNPTETECKAAANSGATCKAYAMLRYRVKSTDWTSECKCNMQVAECTGADDNYYADNGGLHHKIFKGLYLCA